VGMGQGLSNYSDLNVLNGATKCWYFYFIFWFLIERTNFKPPCLAVVRYIPRQTIKSHAHGPDSEGRGRGLTHGIAAATRRTARQIGIR